MEVKFNKNLYNLSAINKAMADYQEFGDFKVSNEKNYFKVKIKNIKQGAKGVIKEEFCNYVLGLMK